MKWIHLSDLHLGKKLYGFSLIEDQKYILESILRIIDEESVGGVLLAGDIYDKSVPASEAVRLFDWFLTELAERELSVFAVSGNHDSRERLAFGAQIMGRAGIHLSPVFSGRIRPVTVEDEYGAVQVWLMPFLKPADVREFFPEEEISSYDDAIRCVVRSMDIDESERNLLVAHQFVTGALRSDSEDITVGGVDNVDGAIFAPFDYTALGHIHSPQKISGASACYCGSPLKYSFSEVNQTKTALILNLKEKGNLEISGVPLSPLRQMREIRGSYMELTSRKNYENTDTDAYLHVTLTDEEEIPDADGRLRSIYPNIMLLDYDNTRTRGYGELSREISGEKKTEAELFAELFEAQNNRRMDSAEREYIERFLEELRGGERK